MCVMGRWVKMFDLAWYLEWEEGEGAPTWGKMCDFTCGDRYLFYNIGIFIL